MLISAFQNHIYQIKKEATIVAASFYIHCLYLVFIQHFIFHVIAVTDDRNQLL
jgi:hypothetical protein